MGIKPTKQPTKQQNNKKTKQQNLELFSLIRNFVRV